MNNDRLGLAIAWVAYLLLLALFGDLAGAWAEWRKDQWLAAWAQAFGALVTMALLLWQHWIQSHQKQEAAIDQVLAHRNTAHFVARYITVVLGPALLRGENVADHQEHLQVCLQELQRLSRAEITPPHLVESFVDVVVRSHEFVGLLKLASQVGLAERERTRVEDVSRTIAQRMRAIDEHLLKAGRGHQLVDGDWHLTQKGAT